MSVSGLVLVMSLQTVYFLPNTPSNFLLMVGVVYWVKETSLNGFLEMWWQGEWAGKVFYSPMIKSQAFSRHVFLNYKLHSYFLFPLLLFMWGRMAGVSGVGYFPSPTWKKRAARGGYLFFYS